MELQKQISLGFLTLMRDDRKESGLTVETKEKEHDQKKSR